jgi:PAS domain S-box-containing protein
VIRRQNSIQRKLTSAIMGTSVTVLLLTGMGFMLYEFFTFNRWIENYVGTMGEIIAENSATAIVFGDVPAANETLATLRTEPHIRTAALYSTNGELFAYWPASEPPPAFNLVPVRPEFAYGVDHLDVFLPVEQFDSRVGTLYMRSDLSARRERFVPYMTIAMIVLAVAVLVASVMARVMQRGIALPILALADIARTVSQRRDYSVRAEKSSEDEVGALTDAFNHMLTQIQERDAALRQNEERYRQLANAVPSLVWRCDAGGAMVYFNEPWYEYTGRTPEESLGLKWCTVVHPDDRGNYVRLWHEAVQQGRAYEAEARLRRHDGEFRWFLSRAHPTRDASGQIISWFGTSTDIEDKKRAEEKVNQMNVSLEARVQERTAQLENSNRELEAFSYSVAHDLRAPLRSIDGFNQALIEDFGNILPEEAKDLLQRSRQSSQRMSQLIDDLLNLSRVARAELRHVRVDLSEMARNIAAELQKSDPERRVNWQIQPGLVVTGDDRLLKLALENLLGNAFKFTRRREVAEIQFASTTLDGKRVFFVRDNGAGFNMQFAGKLFGPFQRLHAATEFPGTGIGLATVQRILARHGGRIWPQAQEGKGATFYFTL